MKRWLSGLAALLLTTSAIAALDGGSIDGISGGGGGTGCTDGDKGDIITSSSCATWTIDPSTITSAKIVDGAVTDADGSLAIKPAAAVVATSNLVLTGEQTIDGQLTSGSIVLLTAQSTGSQNGPWTTAAGAWARPTWFASASTTQAVRFSTIFIRLGSVYAGSTWRLTTASVIIDTTSETWSQTVYAVGAGGTGVQTASANTFFAGPTSGGVAAPTMRLLTCLDGSGVLQCYTAVGNALANPATTPAADKGIYFTAASTTDTFSLTTAGRAIGGLGNGTNGQVTTSDGAGGVAWAANVNVQAFTASGTWTKPAGAVSVRVIAFGPGGAAGSGAKCASVTVCGGGGGGGGGAKDDFISPAGDFGATETVTIGAPGTAGAAVSGAGNGNNGAVGTATTFGAHSTASAGGPGQGGQSTAGSTGGGGASLFAAGGSGASGGGAGLAGGCAGGASAQGSNCSTVGGGAGGAGDSATGGGGNSGGQSSGGAPGGGSGAGLTVGNGTSVGGAGGRSSSSQAVTTGGTAGAGSGGGTGASGTAPTGYRAGSAGAGGGSDTTGNGGNGGAGAVCGAGGGGGGSTQGTSSGAGGAGGGGCMWVISYR